MWYVIQVKTGEEETIAKKLKEHGTKGKPSHSKRRLMGT